VVERLADEDMLPAIVFVFSRAGCDEAVRTVMQSGIRLAESSQAGRIREIAERHTAPLSGTDLEILGYERWLRALENGVAAHHAGMVPAFKEAVEEAFTEGLVKVVFATETLALGVNMPARSVVIENLSKFTGETHELLTPSQYTQLTGRAGRRGIDDLGHAIVLWSPYVGFDQVAALAASRSFRLTSAFRPNYNMAANLVRRHERDEALRLLRQSFAQFQTDRVVVAAERRQVRRRERMAQLETVLAGPGDLEEYVELRRRADAILAADQDRPDRIEEDLASLRPGDLVLFEGHRAAVISVAFRRGTPQVRLLVPSGGIVTRTAGDLTEPLEPRGTIELPEPYAPNNNGFLHETAIRLRRARLAGARPEAQAVLAPVDQAVLDHLSSHACAADPALNDRLDARSELHRLQREVRNERNRTEARGDSLARRFELVLGILDDHGYTDAWELTDRGRRLASLYHESDLLCAECLDTGVFDGLEPAELAGVASTLTYEHRSKTPSPTPRFATKRMRLRVEEIESRAHHLNQAERDAGLPLTRFPDAGFLSMAHRWVAGRDLDDAIGGEELSAGDFVRNVKTLRDLVRQIASLAPERATRRSASQAVEAMRRGVVAASMSLGESGFGEREPIEAYE
jgi:ATP-dependent RNA helicase HelY